LKDNKKQKASIRSKVHPITEGNKQSSFLISPKTSLDLLTVRFEFQLLLTFIASISSGSVRQEQEQQQQQEFLTKVRSAEREREREREQKDNE
jgi:hypothetical protein